MHRQFLPWLGGVWIRCLALLLLANGPSLLAHEGHQAATYEVTPAATRVELGKYLRLRVIDRASNRPTAARFIMTVNGRKYIPPNVARHGLRFISIHQRRKQQFIATYARGSGDVLVPLPSDAKSGTVTVAKGFEFVPVTGSFEIRGSSASVDIHLERWINLQAKGWHAAAEHLHYERTDPKNDGDWLTMLGADGLSHTHFLVLRGGNLAGIWAQQFAHGKAGEATDGKRSIRPG